MMLTIQSPHIQIPVGMHGRFRRISFSKQECTFFQCTVDGTTYEQSIRDTNDCVNNDIGRTQTNSSTFSDAAKMHISFNKKRCAIADSTTRRLGIKVLMG